MLKIFKISSLYLSEDEIYALKDNENLDYLLFLLNEKHQPWLGELAKLEHMLYEVSEMKVIEAAHFHLNPSFRVFKSKWKNLLLFLEDQNILPVKEEEILFLWKYKKHSWNLTFTKDHNKLYEFVKSEEKTESYFNSLEIEHSQLYKDLGIVLTARIMRPLPFLGGKLQTYNMLNSFGLQWHLTQDCDLHCSHCYDRSSRENFPLEDGLNLIKQLVDFCAKYNLSKHISLTGGNPLLHPDFFTLYEEVLNKIGIVSILGNPISDEQIDQLISIGYPRLYQVSLEGLKEYNDNIRGEGNYDAVFDFLRRSKNKGLKVTVMMTVSKENLNQVMLLANQVLSTNSLFNFNRLTCFGEAENFEPIGFKEYELFLRDYNSFQYKKLLLKKKDNLFNIIHLEKNEKFMGGCTGYGCGQAFNFMAVLSDGELHACRKYPSKVGSIHENTLEEIYFSEIADKYRKGPEECLDCEIRPVCGGCPAVTAGLGMDPFKDKDPYCFKKNS